MTAVLRGLKNVSMSRDEEGHRTYECTWIFNTDSPLDGPETVLQAVNTVLPTGSVYSIDNDYDPWAFCTPRLAIAPHPGYSDGDVVQSWQITNEYTTKPMQRCNTTQIENPLLEPYTLSGDFVHVSREMKTDRFDRALRHSNLEPILGPEVEEKVSYPSISISFNSAVLPASTFNLLINKVNDAPLWGFPARCVRFTDCRFERVLYGICFYYYKIQYTFECNLDTFDKKIPSYGLARLKNGAIPFLPESYEIPKDDNGENMPPVFLDYIGRKATPDDVSILGAPIAGNTYIQTVQIAKQANLLLLGIPTVLV
jgi:hypothetical protein